MKFKEIQKRNNEIVPFDQSRITDAIWKAAQSVGGKDKTISEQLAHDVIAFIDQHYSETHSLNVEDVQDAIEKILIDQGHAKTAKSFILYRNKHRELRESNALAGSHKLTWNDLTSLDEFNQMFEFKSKLSALIGKDRIIDYKTLLFTLKKMQRNNEIGMHSENDYLGGNELAANIYQKKYYLKNIETKLIEKRPEDVFARLSAFVASTENTEKKQLYWATQFYDMLYNGYFMPGGRVIAGAGDLYRLKTLANCFVTLIDEDNIESIYKAASECARTYSYGGGIGVDISGLRPQGSVVHNAADASTGSVSFMELYSFTTGLIGQSGRRGALMLTIDIKHPDILRFIKVKQESNWVTKQIVQQAKWSNKFDDDQLREIERQVRENTQTRFANISIKVSDEFMKAVEEQNLHGKNEILVYSRKKGFEYPDTMHHTDNHYSYGIPSKQLEDYTLLGNFKDTEALNDWLAKHCKEVITKEQLNDDDKRDLFGDYVLSLEDMAEDLCIKYAGDYLVYFNSKPTGIIKSLVKARDIWDVFVEGNYKTAEPGLIFWDAMTKYSPSNYVGTKIASTNPCGEVPLEDGGACNLGSVNLSMFVLDGYTDKARVDWTKLKEVSSDAIRFLDNVVEWNEDLNALEKQRVAAKETRRLGFGVMGIADMLNQLGIGYDSEEGLALMEKVMSFVADASYQASALLAEEKGPSPIYEAEAYMQCPFFQESLTEETRALVKQKGLRNIAILSIAPTGSISNITLGFRIGSKNYVGISSGIEPIFSLYYTRRSESFGNVFFKIFHSSVQAFIDLQEVTEQVNEAKDMESLTKILPAFFFRTAHFIKPMQRVKIQGLCQKYIDHSISSTVNLSEDINPEVISNVYLDAWKNKLKGITIYRDGSRYPILSVESNATEFQAFKEKMFKVTIGDTTKQVRGDDVIAKADGTLTTMYHEFMKKQTQPKDEVEAHAQIRIE